MLLVILGTPNYCPDAGIPEQLDISHGGLRGYSERITRLSSQPRINSGRNRASIPRQRCSNVQESKAFLA